MMHSRLFFVALLLVWGSALHAQIGNQGTLPARASLQDCINFALNNGVRVQKALIDEEIGEREIASALSEWFPQISASGNYNHNIIIPTNVIGDQVIQMGQNNAAAAILQADQTLLNPRLLQASKAAKFIREQNAHNTENQKINTIVEVSKAYYDILTSEEQVNIVGENILRLEKQFADAKARYESGLVDKTDYTRAQIAMSNAKAEEKRVREVLKYKYAYLKELIGLDSKNPVTLSFDNASMESEILLDTSLSVTHERRVEYQQLMTNRQLQRLNSQYHRWTFLPSVNAFYNYALDYRDNEFSNLFREDFPRSVFGLSVQIPIFQGTKRIQEIRKSRLQEERMDWDLLDLRNRINSEYELAMATYKANLVDLETSRENVSRSEEVYRVIKLQYDEGIRTYLDLMMADTDLKTTQINYLNSLYAVLSGKLDVQRALGTVDTP